MSELVSILIRHPTSFEYYWFITVLCKHSRFAHFLKLKMVKIGQAFISVACIFIIKSTCIFLCIVCETSMTVKPISKVTKRVAHSAHWNSTNSSFWNLHIGLRALALYIRNLEWIFSFRKARKPPNQKKGTSCNTEHIWVYAMWIQWWDRLSQKGEKKMMKVFAGSFCYLHQRGHGKVHWYQLKAKALNLSEPQDLLFWLHVLSMQRLQ